MTDKQVLAEIAGSRELRDMCRWVTRSTDHADIFQDVMLRLATTKPGTLARLHLEGPSAIKAYVTRCFVDYARDKYRTFSPAYNPNKHVYCDPADRILEVEDVQPDTEPEVLNAAREFVVEEYKKNRVGDTRAQSFRRLMVEFLFPLDPNAPSYTVASLAKSTDIPKRTLYDHLRHIRNDLRRDYADLLERLGLRDERGLDL